MKKFAYFMVLTGFLVIGVVGCKEKSIDPPRVVFVKGNVTIEKQPIIQGSPIFNGVKIEMDKASYVDILFPDGTLVRLKEAVASLDWKEGKTEWNLVSGSLFSSVVRKKKSDQFTVVTPTSVLGVRGTKFLAEEKENQTYVCVCDGSVGARLKDGTEEKIVKLGQDLFLNSGKKLEDPVDSPDMKKMTDEVFLDMEKNIK